MKYKIIKAKDHTKEIDGLIKICSSLNLIKKIQEQGKIFFPCITYGTKGKSYKVFKTIATRPHVSAKSEIKGAEYFKKHNIYFDTNIGEDVLESVPLHHIIWLSTKKSESISWRRFRGMNVEDKKYIISDVSKSITDSLHFLSKLTRPLKVSIAIGHSGYSNVLDNCQSIDTIHFHTTCFYESKYTMTTMTDDQKHMYINNYNRLISEFPKSIKKILRDRFCSYKIELVKDYSNSIVPMHFEVTMEENTSIEETLLSIASLEAKLHSFWKNLKAKRNDVPNTPGFIVEMDVKKVDNGKFFIKKIKLAPAKHGPAELINKCLVKIE